jgi:hypothetical protein
MELNLGTRPGQANDGPIAGGNFLNGSIFEIGSVRPQIHEIPLTLFIAVEFQVIARDDGTVEDNMVIRGATDANNCVILKRPAFQRDGLVGVEES